MFGLDTLDELRAFGLNLALAALLVVCFVCPFFPPRKDDLVGTRLAIIGLVGSSSIAIINPAGCLLLGFVVLMIFILSAHDGP